MIHGAFKYKEGVQEMTDNPDIIAINMADTHSSYDTYSKILWEIESIKNHHKNSQILILFNGDLFESGNIIAKKSNGLIDLYFLKRLVQCGKVIINVGNHEFDLMSPKEFLSKTEETGAIVIGNVSAEGMPELKRYTDIEIENKTIRIMGIGVDQIDTYPIELQNSLSIPEPVKWTQTNYPKIKEDTDHIIVLSHAGLVPDLALLKYFENDASILYMAGGHDHINLREAVHGVEYMHNGFKGERLNIAKIYIKNKEQAEIIFSDIITKEVKEQDSEMQNLIDNVTKNELDSEDTKIVGTVKNTMSVVEAALWTVEVMRKKTNADAAFLNHTSFGAGLRKGKLPKYLFEQFMRFDNKVMSAEVDGETLSKILAKCNQHEKSDINTRSGDFLYTGHIEPEEHKKYKIVTTGWVALEINQEKYFGRKIKFEQIPNLITKGLIADALKD